MKDFLSYAHLVFCKYGRFFKQINKVKKQGDIIEVTQAININSDIG